MLWALIILLPFFAAVLRERHPYWQLGGAMLVLVLAFDGRIAFAVGFWVLLLALAFLAPRTR